MPTTQDPWYVLRLAAGPSPPFPPPNYAMLQILPHYYTKRHREWNS
jgi:hypothetical protein